MYRITFWSSMVAIRMLLLLLADAHTYTLFWVTTAGWLAGVDGAIGPLFSQPVLPLSFVRIS